MAELREIDTRLAALTREKRLWNACKALRRRP